MYNVFVSMFVCVRDLVEFVSHNQLWERLQVDLYVGLMCNNIMTHCSLLVFSNFDYCLAH